MQIISFRRFMVLSFVAAGMGSSTVLADEASRQACDRLTAVEYDRDDPTGLAPVDFTDIDWRKALPA